MALTKVSTGMLSADAASVDLNIDAGTLFIDASANRVGIGTTSPSNLLSLKSGTNTDIEFGSESGGGFIQTYNRTSSAFGYFRFITTSGETMRLDTSGNVGIGTTSPNVSSYDANANALTISGTNRSLLELRGATGANSTQLGAIRFLSGSTSEADIICELDSSGNGFLTFDTNGSEAMRIDSSGNVGIGTVSPSSPFHVNVGTNLNFEVENSSSTLRLSALNDARSANIAMQFASSSFEFITGDVIVGAGSGNAALGIKSGTSNTAKINFGDSSNDDAGIITYTNDSGGSDNMAFTVGTSEAMRILHNGDVGIGSTTVDRGKLHINHIVQSSAGAFSDPHIALSFSSAPTDNDSFAGISYATSDSDNYGWTVGAERTTSGVGDFIFTQHNNSATGSEKVRIDSNGVLFLGVPGGNSTAIIQGTSGAGSTNQPGTDLQLKGGSGGGTGGSKIKFFTAPGGSSGTSESAATEVAQFDNSGNLLVGTNSASGQITVDNGGDNTGLYIKQSSSSTNYTPFLIHNDYITGGQTGTLFSFERADGTAVGGVTATVSATSYNTSSDQRLKENIVDAPSASDDIDAIQVRSFDWKADGSHQKYGMVAQELVTVAPSAVSQPEDPEEMMGVDYSKLVPMLIKEVQQLRARVAQLEGEN